MGMYIALVTFERLNSSQCVLDEPYRGAVGWLGVRAICEEECLEQIELSLSAAGLRVLEVEDVTEVKSLLDIEVHDSHLALNVRSSDAGDEVIWGTLHRYLADGEA